MANRIGRVHKLGKQNKKGPGMNNNILTVSIESSFCHNKDDINIDMTLNSSSNNTVLSTTTAAVHEKPDDTTDKESSNNSKTIKSQLQTLLLMMMINNFKDKVKHSHCHLIVCPSIYRINTNT